MKTGILIQNNVSTGDLNRGRRVEPRLLFGSFCRSKKNVKPFPFGSFPLHGKHAPVGAARCACYEASRFCKPRSSAPYGGCAQAAARHFPATKPPKRHRPLTKFSGLCLLIQYNRVKRTRLQFVADILYCHSLFKVKWIDNNCHTAAIHVLKYCLSCCC